MKLKPFDEVFITGFIYFTIAYWQTGTSRSYLSNVSGKQFPLHTQRTNQNLRCSSHLILPLQMSSNHYRKQSYKAVQFTSTRGVGKFGFSFHNSFKSGKNFFLAIRCTTIAFYLTEKKLSNTYLASEKTQIILGDIPAQYSK